jgi:pantetheine-phosphate adenylyltransferase
VKRALVPGSFDPIHNGHLEVIERVASMFDEVLVAAVHNPNKPSGFFTLAEREAMLAETLGHIGNVTIGHFWGLLVNYAEDQNCSVIVKGLRAVSDFEYELQMAQMNNQLKGIPTLFLPTASRHSFLASRLIREVAQYGGDVSTMVPPGVARALAAKFPRDGADG